MEGRKDDQGKQRMELVPPETIEALAQVLTDGANKYGDRNWETGMKWSRLYAALFRHMLAWWQGENEDPDSGRSHLWHALFCVSSLVAYEQRGVGSDDRPVDTDLADWVKCMVDNAGHDPDNEEWESDSDTITDCFGQKYGRWCPHCHAEMEVVRPGKVQCSQSCEWQEASGDVMSEKEEATKCEICGNYRTDICTYKGFLTCERCIRLDFGDLMPYKEISPGVYDGDQKDVMDEKEEQRWIEKEREQQERLEKTAFYGICDVCGQDGSVKNYKSRVICGNCFIAMQA